MNTQQPSEFHTTGVVTFGEIGTDGKYILRSLRKLFGISTPPDDTVLTLRLGNNKNRFDITSAGKVITIEQSIEGEGLKLFIRDLVETDEGSSGRQVAYSSDGTYTDYNVTVERAVNGKVDYQLAGKANDIQTGHLEFCNSVMGKANDFFEIARLSFLEAHLKRNNGKLTLQGNNVPDLVAEFCKVMGVDGKTIYMPADTILTLEADQDELIHTARMIAKGGFSANIESKGPETRWSWQGIGEGTGTANVYNIATHHFQRVAGRFFDGEGFKVDKIEFSSSERHYQREMSDRVSSFALNCYAFRFIGA